MTETIDLLDPTTQKVILRFTGNDPATQFKQAGFGDYFSKVPASGGSNKFLEIPGQLHKFYRDLVDEINILYAQDHFIPLAILIRKLLENLIIDILRKKYGGKKPELDLYFNTGKQRFQDFSALIGSLESKLPDFKPISSSLDIKLIRKIEKCKQKGNSAAHSIDVDIKKEWFDINKRDINHIINTLVIILNNIS